MFLLFYNNISVDKLLFNGFDSRGFSDFEIFEIITNNIINVRRKHAPPIIYHLYLTKNDSAGFGVAFGVAAGVKPPPVGGGVKPGVTAGDVAATCEQ